MKPLVSILLPSRARVGRLKKTVKNILDTATGTDFEILIRFDDDDPESLAAIKELEWFKPVKCFTGPRHGYTKLCTIYYPDLEDKAEGSFIWVANDDMVVTGDWLGQLRKVPLTGFIVHPQVSKLHESVYPYCKGGPFPIWPRHAWKRFSEFYPAPSDTGSEILFRENGWKVWFLKDVMIFHDRPPEDELAEHRGPGLPKGKAKTSPRVVGITSLHRHEI